MKRSFVASSLVVALTSFLSTAYAAQYPKDIQGDWINVDTPAKEVKDTCKNFPPLSITANDATFSTEASCRAVKVSGKDGKYTITESCSSEGGKGKRAQNYEVNGDIITIGGAKDKKENYWKMKRCAK